MDSKEDRSEQRAAEQAETTLEEQRELLAAATARLRARIGKPLPEGSEPDAAAAVAAPLAREDEAPEKQGDDDAPSSAPAEEAPGGATVEMIVERAHRIVRGSRESERAPVLPVPDPEKEAATQGAAPDAPAAKPTTEPSAEAAARPAPVPVAGSKPRPQRSSPPWLARALRDMAVREPTDAGRLFLALLPAHGLVESRDLRYDLVLDDTGCLAIDLVAGQVTISEQLTPRPAGAVDFQVHTSLAGLGVAVAGGRMRRLTTRERVRVTPDAGQLDTLRLLARAPLGLHALHAAGVRPDPMLAYRALTASIEPQWTAGHHFTLLHEVAGSPAHRCCLHVDGERPVSVISPVAPQFKATVVVRCPPERFLPLLSGELTRAEEQELVQGEVDALTALQDWIARIEWSGAYGG